MQPVCYGCFAPLEGNPAVCPHCGYPVHAAAVEPHILKPGTVLNQKYTLGKTLGEGGFGITYLAWDNNMQTKIAIKEFYPANLIKRDTTERNDTQLYLLTQSLEAEFHAGMERFVREASVLSKFFHLPGIVSVKDFFYENKTAYIVMEYIDGITLKEYLRQKGGTLSLDETLKLMKPVMESLAIVHKEKMLHRDISPDNLMVSADDQVKLIDFGSARYYDLQSDKSMTVVLKHGYAPIEQYSANGNQGTWTDVYSLCATMYRMLTGKVPPEAIERIREDRLEPVGARVKKVPANIRTAIQKGLSVMPEHRQQTVEELYHDIYISRQDLKTEKRSRRYQSINRLLIRLIIVLVLLIALAAAWVKRDTLRDFGARVRNGFAAAGETNEADAGAQAYRQMRAGAADASAQSDIAIVRDGKLNNAAQGYTVGEILDRYSETEGSWYTYEDSAAAQKYVYYEGERDGAPFALEFEVYADDTFRLTGASQNNTALERYADFFQGILDTLGL